MRGSGERRRSAAAFGAGETYSGLIGSVRAVIEGFVVALSTNGFLITVNAAACSRQQMVAIGAVITCNAA